MSETQKTKSSFISIVGATNAGKSTLLNAMLDKKISIISHKVQTTRFNIKGIKQVDDTQLVFIDTPGDFDPKRRLDKAMISSIWNAVSDSEIVIYLMDCTKARREGYNDKFIQQLKQISKDKRVLLVLNKVDLIKKETLLEITQRYNEYGFFDATYMISATKSQGVQDIVDDLVEHSQPSPWYYEVDQQTDINDKLFCAEITRESVYKYLHQELPYEINVSTDVIEDKENKIEIHQTIYATRKSHKLIIIGNKGSSLKRIGSEARDQLRRHFRKRVDLRLFVKIKDNWQDTKEFYDDMGLDF